MASRRLLIVLPDAALGGGHFMNLRLASILIRRGWDVSVAFLFGRGDQDFYKERYPDVRQIRLGADRVHSRMTLPVRLAKLARQFDVVVAGLDLAATNYSYLASMLSRKPLLVWMHIAFGQQMLRVSKLDRWASLLVYRRIKEIVFPSQGALDSLRHALGTTPAGARWHVVENFNEAKPSGPEAGELLPSHIFSRPVVISIGRLAEQKALDRLIHAHAGLLAEGRPHHLVILGEGPERSGLEALAAALGVSDSVWMPGHVNGAYQWLRRATVFALCSKYEGLPLVLLEALQSGTPVVSMDCPAGPREILEGGKAGLLTPEGDIKAFQNAIGRLLSSPELRQSLSQQGLERSTYFSIERVIPLWETLLDEAIQRHAKA